MNVNGNAYVNTLAAAWPDIARDSILLGINGETPSNLAVDEPGFNYPYVNYVGRSTFGASPKPRRSLRNTTPHQPTALPGNGWPGGSDRGGSLLIEERGHRGLHLMVDSLGELAIEDGAVVPTRDDLDHGVALQLGQ